MGNMLIANNGFLEFEQVMCGAGFLLIANI